MIYGLQDLDALARVCYHAQELSILSEGPFIPYGEMMDAKRDLDIAFMELMHKSKEKHEPS